MWVIFVGGVLSAGGLASFDLTSSFRMSGRSTYCPQSSSYDERRSTSWIFPQEDFSKPRSFVRNVSFFGSFRGLKGQIWVHLAIGGRWVKHKCGFSASSAPVIQQFQVRGSCLLWKKTFLVLFSMRIH